LFLFFDMGRFWFSPFGTSWYWLNNG
jgi:hypothetical protein